MSNKKSNHSHPSNLEILYQDQWIVVINKPEGLLSVPYSGCSQNASTAAEAGTDPYPARYPDQAADPVGNGGRCGGPGCRSGALRLPPLWGLDSDAGIGTAVGDPRSLHPYWDRF